MVGAAAAAAGAGAVGDILGSLIGEALAAGDYEEANRLMQEAARSYDGMTAPSDFAEAGGTAMDDISVDPRLRASRMKALERLQQVGLEGGMDAESRAAVEQAKMDAAGYEQQQRGAIMQDAQARGMMNSNLSQAQALMAQQGGANRVGMMGIQAAGDARRRALDALSQSGELAGSIERDEYGMQADRAGAQDAIGMFNARNRNDFNQSQFDNSLSLKDRQMAGKLAEAGMYEERAARKSGKARGVGQGIGAAGGYLYGASQETPTKKGGPY